MGAEGCRRAFESTSPTMHGFVQDTSRLQKTVSDPTQLGSFLEYVLFMILYSVLTFSNHDYPRFAGVATDPVVSLPPPVQYSAYIVARA